MSAIDPDELAALEEERDFLLRSLDDLERERAAGDVDDHDHRVLRDDYTTRAADVLRSIEAGQASLRSAPPPPRSRRLVTFAGIAIVAVVAGALVAQASGRRGSGEITGLDVTAASGRITQCQQAERDDDVDEALACYSDVLEALPANVEALTFRGWLQVRQFDVDAGLEDLDAAIQLAPRSTAPFVFRSSGRARAGNATGALADLAEFYDNGPTDDERGLADQFRTSIVDRALDTCIDGDVDGSIGAEELVRCYRDVLRIDDGNGVAHVYLGWLLARSGVADDLAIEHLDDGLAADPSVTAGYVFRAALRAHLGDVDGARADLAELDQRDVPEGQRVAAEEVRSALDEGRDPLPAPSG